MRSFACFALAAWLVLGCSSSGSGDADTAGTDVVADQAEQTGVDTNVTPDLPPDLGQDLTVIEVVTDTAVDPGQPDTPADAVEHYTTCTDLFFQCVSKCDDEGEMTCENACIGKAEPDAAAAMATLGTCVETKCADMADAVAWVDCLGNSDEKCGGDFTTCVGGTDICKNVRTCWLTNCSPADLGEWDHGCAIGCMATGDATAKQSFSAFYTCIFENCGTAADFNACFTAKAGNECANHNAFCDQM